VAFTTVPIPINQMCIPVVSDAVDSGHKEIQIGHLKPDKIPTKLLSNEV
jgi:hypothetical protein